MKRHGKFVISAPTPKVDMVERQQLEQEQKNRQMQDEASAVNWAAWAKDAERRKKERDAEYYAHYYHTHREYCDGSGDC